MISTAEIWDFNARQRVARLALPAGATRTASTDKYILDAHERFILVSMRSRILLVLTAICALAFATTAFAKTIIGSNAAETLTGTATARTRSTASAAAT